MTTAKKSPSPRQRDTRFKGYFTDRWVGSTKGFEQEVQYAEKLKKGLALVLYVSPLPYSTKTWRATYYDQGKARSVRIGTYPQMTLKQAKKHAYDEFDPDREIARKQAGSFKSVAEDWIKNYVDKKGLRSKHEIERQLTAYVYPKWQDLPIFDIDRTEVNKLLDRVESKHGASQADAVLSTIRGIMIWYAAKRNHKYSPAIVPKMRRDEREASEKARDRILTRQEIRAVWKACDAIEDYGDIVKLLLLTGQRLRKITGMRWDDIVETLDVEMNRDEQAAVVTYKNVWVVRTEKREKGNIGAVALPDLAVEIIKKRKKIGKNPYIFASEQGKETVKGFSKWKTRLDTKVAETLHDMPEWRLHDLRRTARSLLAELRVPDDIAERTLGHTIRGVQGVYNRYPYLAEKSDALNRLASLISIILNPPDQSNVVSMPGLSKTPARAAQKFR